nr:putative late blight resistance protein homolog R1B-16 [Ipomoea batatas]
MYFVWKEISVFSRLPKLEVLKLRGCSCIDEEWKLSEDEIFEQLAYLEIHTIRFRRWEASNNHFPNLQHLILSGCYKLEEIPDGFGEIGTLELIKLKYCLPSVVDSAKQILEQQHDAGNDNMFVIEEGTLKPAQSNEDDEPEDDEPDEDDEFDEDDEHNEDDESDEDDEPDGDDEFDEDDEPMKMKMMSRSEDAPKEERKRGMYVSFSGSFSLACFQLTCGKQNLSSITHDRVWEEKLSEEESEMDK